MGGDRTNAERQRRYIARLKAQAGVSNAPDAPGIAKSGVSNALVQELAQANARIAAMAEELAAAKARIAELEKAGAAPVTKSAAIDPATLSMTAQQKMEAWKRQQMRAMERAFEQRVLDEIRKRVDEMILPHWKKQIDQAKAIFNRRKGVMSKEDYKTILSCLHPDSRLSASDKKLGAAFRLFNSLEKFLLEETQSPTDLQEGKLPRTMAEWDRRRAAAEAEQKAKRAAGRSAVRPR